jgi:hypothetical protein
MEKRFGLFFNLKKPRGSYDTELSVYLRIAINGTRTELSTKRKWSSPKWNIAAGRADSRTWAMQPKGPFRVLPLTQNCTPDVSKTNRFVFNEILIH